MTKIRKGNDLVITWQVIINGGETTLGDLEDVTLELTDSNGGLCPIEYEIAGDTATVRFRGKDQQRIGPYKLTLWVKRGQNGQAVVDHCDAFYLTSCSDQADSGTQTNPTVETAVIVDTVNLAVGIRGDDGITPHIDEETGNWFLDTVDTGVHAQGPKGEDGVGEAPVDGNVYGRKDGAWEKVTDKDVVPDIDDIRAEAEAGNEAYLNAFQDLSITLAPDPGKVDNFTYVKSINVDSTDPTQLDVVYGDEVRDGFNSIDTDVIPFDPYGSVVVADVTKDSDDPRKLYVSKKRVVSRTEVGDIADLETTVKTSVVAAVNENHGKIAAKADDSSVMHLTGDESSTGKKSFEKISLDCDNDVAIGIDLYASKAQDTETLTLESQVHDLVRLRNLAAPVEGEDATNKNYVDVEVATAVHKTGDETISGNKTFEGNVKADFLGTKMLQIPRQDDEDWVNCFADTNDEGNSVVKVQGDETLYNIEVERDPDNEWELTRKGYVDTQLATKANDAEVVKVVAQSLPSADRKIARENIYALAYEEQTLTDDQQTQARANLGLTDIYNDWVSAGTAITNLEGVI